MKWEALCIVELLLLLLLPGKLTGFFVPCFSLNVFQLQLSQPPLKFGWLFVCLLWFSFEFLLSFSQMPVHHSIYILVATCFLSSKVGRQVCIMYGISWIQSPYERREMRYKKCTWIMAICCILFCKKLFQFCGELTLGLIGWSFVVTRRKKLLNKLQKGS